MAISLGNAITCIKEDRKWISKCIIGAIIGFIIPFIVGGTQGYLEAIGVIKENSLIANIITYAISIIVGFYITGFEYTTMNRVINSVEPFKMAEWNEKKLILTGLKVTLAWIGWVLLSIFVFGLGFILVAIAIIAVGALIGALVKMFLNIDLEIIKMFLIAIGNIIGIIYGLYLAQFINNAFACYFKTLKFKDLIAFKKHFRIIRENKHINWTLVGKNILLFLTFLLVIMALLITVVGIILIPFVCFAGCFVSYNLISQYAKEIEIDKYLQA